MGKRISNHGKQRMAERAGISHKGEAKKNCKKAMDRGIRHSETRGELNVWLSSKAFRHKKKGTQFRIFRDYLYIFSNGTLVTMFQLPEEVKKLIKECVSEDVYIRYMQDIHKKDFWKAAERVEKEGEKKKGLRSAFLSRVIISDIEDNVRDLPVTIIKVRFDKNNVLVVFYKLEGQKRTVPCQVESYIREHYPCRFVWLKRVDKEKAAPEETRLVYSGEEDDTPNPFAELLKKAIEGVRSEP